MKTPKVGIIIQARSTSTRLPNKVLKELPYSSGISGLAQIIRRLKRSKKASEIIVATTTNKCDNAIVKIAKKEKVKFFRGSESNVLERYYLAAKKNNLDVVVRVTGDCPCIDPLIVDILIDKHMKSKADYTSNTVKRTFPHGLDAEVANFTAVAQAYNEANLNFEKEHVFPFITRAKKGMFKISGVEAKKILRHPEIRITLDTQDDYNLLCAVFDYLYPKNKFFGAKDIVRLFRKKQWLGLLNMRVVQKKSGLSKKNELKEAVNIMHLQELKYAEKILKKRLKCV
jgi:spore coat polysaccharide biosynthesis protein SpsF